MSLSGISRIIATRRILVSRCFALLFFTLIAINQPLFSQNLLSFFFFFIGLVAIGVAIVGRLWCSLYISGYKNESLITIGPYSMCRNPLYFFSFLGFSGLGLTSGSISLGLGVAVIYLLAYQAVIDGEEQFLRDKFTDSFDAYKASVPRLWPKLSLLKEPEQYTVSPILFRQTMVDVIWFLWFAGLIQFFDALHRFHIWNPLISLP